MNEKIIYKTKEYWGGIVVCFNHAVSLAMKDITVYPDVLESGYYTYELHKCKMCQKAKESKGEWNEILGNFGG